MPCICFPQLYAQCHLWSCAISAKWRLTFHEYILVQFYSASQYLKTVFAIQYFTLSLTGSQFIFLKGDRSVWDLGGKFRQKRINLFWLFWSLSFKFFVKRKTMRNIHNQNAAESAYYIIVFYTQGIGTCFGNAGISVRH